MKLFKRGRQSRSLAQGALIAFALALCGCQSLSKVGEGFGNMGDKALEAIGYKKPDVPALPELPESAKPARKLKLRIAASDSLNVDAAGRSLSLVVRIYKLRSTTAFLNAPYDVFGNAAKEKELLGDDIIESRELLLLPGQQQEISERWAREATHIGVVGLFRAPAPQRWRYAFELETFQLGDGFLLGAHSCALSVASGEPVGLTKDAMKLIPANCPSAN